MDNNRSCGFNDIYKHSIRPAYDYQYAKDFYKKNDCRYELVKEYIRLIFKIKHVRVYNCKIDYIRNDNIFFNINVYIKDSLKIFGENNRYIIEEKNDYVDLFYKALEKFPIIELQERKINVNGVFIINYIICAKSYALWKSINPLNETLKRRYPSIQYIYNWNTTLYVFFSEENLINSFHNSTNAFQLKQIAYQVIKEFDIDHVWSIETLSIMLDDYNKYKSLGNRTYFDSEAMFNGLII